MGPHSVNHSVKEVPKRSSFLPQQFSRPKSGPRAVIPRRGLPDDHAQHGSERQPGLGRSEGGQEIVTVTALLPQPHSYFT